MPPKKPIRSARATQPATEQSAPTTALPVVPLPQTTQAISTSDTARLPSDVETSDSPAGNNNDHLDSPIQLSTDAAEREGSADWFIDPNSFLARSTVDGAYPKMLSAFDSWKTDPSVSGRVAAFMEYGMDLKAFPGNFGKHLVYRKTQDTPLHIVFFGEIAPANCGTALGAKGNHYIGTSGNVSLAAFIWITLIKTLSETQLQTAPKFGMCWLFDHLPMHLRNYSKCIKTRSPS